MSRSMISPKQRDFDFYLDSLEQRGIKLDCLKAYSTAGDIRPGRAYQWEANAVLREGEDDPLTGVGWTPIEAVRSLYSFCKKLTTPLK
jgi:hypothetical protein